MKIHNPSSGNSTSRSTLKIISKEILKNKSPTSRNSRIHNLNDSRSSDKNDKGIMSPPMLIKDKINYSPGYGLWCHNLNENKKDHKKVNNYHPYIALPKKELENNLICNFDKLMVEQLKIQVKDLITKLENALGNLSDYEYRAKRSEEMCRSLQEITVKKVNEHREMSDMLQQLEDEVVNLNEALKMTKKEINRINNDLIVERENFSSFRKNFELYKDNRNIIEDKLKNEIKNLTEQLLSDGTNNKKRKEDGMPLQKKLTTNIDLSKENDKISQRLVNMNENILKYQLEIVDLKKKHDEEEKVKKNLLEIIKKKKEKIELYKTDLSKLIVLFEESTKEKKWKDNLLIQKNIMIDALKVKLEKKNDKKLLPNIKKLQSNNNEILVESVEPKEQVVLVRSQPELFAK